MVHGRGSNKKVGIEGRGRALFDLDAGREADQNYSSQRPHGGSPCGVCSSGPIAVFRLFH